MRVCRVKQTSVGKINRDDDYTDASEEKRILLIKKLSEIPWENWWSPQTFLQNNPLFDYGLKVKYEIKHVVRCFKFGKKKKIKPTIIFLVYCLFIP